MKCKISHITYYGLLHDLLQEESVTFTVNNFMYIYIVVVNDHMFQHVYCHTIQIIGMHILI
jgi:hypothetical protein